MRRIVALYGVLFLFALLVLAKHGEHESESEDDDDDKDNTQLTPPPQTSTVTVPFISTILSTVTSPPPPVQPQPQPQPQPAPPPSPTSQVQPPASPVSSQPPQPSQENPPSQTTENGVNTQPPQPSQEDPPPQTTPDGVKETAMQTSPQGSDSSAPSSSGVPLANALHFAPPANVTTCASTVFTWEFFSSNSVPVTIVVTNERATTPSDNNSAAFSPRETMPALVTRTLTTSVQASVCVVSWPKVNVPAGTYSVLAFDTARTANLFAQSPNFIVTDGSDTSCVTGSDGPIPGVDGGAAGGTGGRGRNLSTGALVGTIVGVVVAVFGLIAAFTLPSFVKKTLAKRSPRRPGAPYHLF